MTVTEIITNPFSSPLLAGEYSTAIELQRLVVHLFNGSDMPDMAKLMRSDDEHRELAFAMLEHYAQHGENCPVFMGVARALVEVIHDAHCG